MRGQQPSRLQTINVNLKSVMASFFFRIKYTLLIDKRKEDYYHEGNF